MSYEWDNKKPTAQMRWINQPQNQVECAWEGFLNIQYTTESHQTFVDEIASDYEGSGFHLQKRVWKSCPRRLRQRCVILSNLELKRPHADRLDFWQTQLFQEYLPTGVRFSATQTNQPRSLAYLPQIVPESKPS